MESNNNRSSFIIMDNIVPRPDDNMNVVRYYDELERVPFNFPLDLRVNGLEVKHLYRADDVLQHIGNKMYNNGPFGPFYSSYNTAVKSKDSLFNLSRIKYNFRLYGTDNMEHRYINIPGEVLDVSIGNQLSDNYYKKVHDDHMHYDIYTIYNDKKQIAKYKSFSLQGFIYDLNNVIFTQEFSDLAYEQRNIHHPYGLPWNNDKMSKRISRVLFFTFIELYNKNKRNLLELYTSIKDILRPRLNMTNNSILSVAFGIVRILMLHIDRTLIENQMIINSLNNDMILLARGLGLPPTGTPLIPNIDDILVINQLEKISGLYVFLYYIVKMIIYYKIHNNGTLIGAEFNNNSFARFIAEIKVSISNIQIINGMIINTRDFKMGKTLNRIDLESF